jgi:hypothetical protein
MNLESVVRDCFDEVTQGQAGELSLQRRLSEYGLSSLQMIVFVTRVCEESGLALTALTEEDLAGVKCGADVVKLIAGALAS